MEHISARATQEWIRAHTGMLERVWGHVYHDEVVDVYYVAHDGERYDYYCPDCHVDNFPDADGAYDYELDREMELDDQQQERLEYGLCVACGRDTPYMVVSPREILRALEPLEDDEESE